MKEKCQDMIKYEIVVIIGCSAIMISLKQESLLSALKALDLLHNLILLLQSEEAAKKCLNNEM